MPREAHICNTPKCDNNAQHTCAICTQFVCEKHNDTVISVCTVDLVHKAATERVAENLVDYHVFFSVCFGCAALLIEKQIQHDLRENTVHPGVEELFGTWPAAIQQAVTRRALTENNEKDKP